MVLDFIEIIITDCFCLRQFAYKTNKYRESCAE
jgi:hypothetical protein